MDVSSIGPGTLDLFTPSVGPKPEDDAPDSPQAAPREPAPLPEGTGEEIDTSA